MSYVGIQDWDAAARQLQNARPQKRREDEEPEVSDATDGLQNGGDMAHLDTAAAGQAQQSLFNCKQSKG